jgi:hypothetical protein
VIRDNLAARTDWVAGCAVRAEDRCVAVQAGEVVCAAGIRLIVCAVEDVVRLVGGVEDVSPEECGADFVTLASNELIRMRGETCQPFQQRNCCQDRWTRMCNHRVHQGCLQQHVLPGSTR